jgi:hypothetical protein
VETPIGRAVAEKLGQMELRASIPENYVAVDSNVAFRVNGRPINRTLVHWDDFTAPGSHLSLHTPWGVTLLGMRVGHTAPVYGRSGVVEELTVDSVSHAVDPTLNRSQTRPPRIGQPERHSRSAPVSSDERAISL